MKLNEILNEWVAVIKNKDGKEKRFKKADSPEAIAWKDSSSPKKEKTGKNKKYSLEWWSDQDVDTLPWDKITDYDSDEVNRIVKAEDFGKNVDWNLSQHYAKDVDGLSVAARKVRVTIEYSKDDDLGNDEDVIDSQTIGVRRDPKNPTKLVFDGFKS